MNSLPQQPKPPSSLDPEEARRQHERDLAARKEEHERDLAARQDAKESRLAAEKEKLERELASKKEEHEKRLEKYKARITWLTASLGLVGVVGAALIGLLAKQTSDLGVKLNTGIPTGFWEDFHRGAEAWVKLSDAKTPVSQIVPVQSPPNPKPVPETSQPVSSPRTSEIPGGQTADIRPATPALTEGRCFGLDPTNWQINKGPVTALARGYNIKISLQNKSAVARGLAYFGDPAMTDNLGDRLTFIATSLSNREDSPLTFAPGVEMSVDLTFPNGSFVDPSGKGVASYLGFTLPIHEVVEGKTTIESLGCENLTIPPRSVN